MATGSFLYEVKINNDSDAKRFVEALEKAEQKSDKDVVVNKPCSNASKEEIRIMFGSIK